MKAWFWQRSPAAHTWGWHSYISIRLMHSESMPHGFSSDALQLQRGISDRSAVMICTFPTGRFTWETETGGWCFHRTSQWTALFVRLENHRWACGDMWYPNVPVRRRLLVILSVLLKLLHLLFCLQLFETLRCFSQRWKDKINELREGSHV